MIHRFHQDKNRWDGIEPHIYKENPGVFRDVTKQVLFDNEADLPVQFRYFQVEKGGFSSFEHHKHMHAVMIFKGKGHALLGNQVVEVHEGDFITIAPWEWHQFKADMGDILGFLCLVNHDRDIPVYPTEEDIREIRKNPEAAHFLDEE
ncbi:cupin domain-containing protein [uncultured Dialister sp.]|uniref:cupin domain-containing protein n=1 Tax=uncultured Dialister sp. TaxID=278064 RepID=UPI00265ED15E|nr:cupin domain-containing protein [uncultured Dialister sp.]